jgi:hypothetical protein
VLGVRDGLGFAGLRTFRWREPEAKFMITDVRR